MAGAIFGGGYGGYFEALRPSEDRTRITPFLPSQNVGQRVSTLDRVSLSAIAHALYDNGGLPALAVNQIAMYAGPVRPQANCGDDAINDLYEAYWAEWCKRADFYGRPEMDFYALQTVLCQSIDLDGDVGVLVTADAGFPQVQVIEGWRIGLVHDGGENAQDGVRVDTKGRVQGYVVSGQDGNPQEVAAGQMMIARDPSPTGTYRGVCPLRRGMNDIRDARDIQAFEKLAVKHNAALIGVIEGEPMDEGAAFN
ncbi:MAG: phage portal protein, partial [Verrucomicrobiota bacterium]